MNLTILIPTLPERKAFLDAIVTNLTSQIGEREVTILVNSIGREITIGKKRQLMLEECKRNGNVDYVVHVDDDDVVSSDYVSSIYDAIQSSPDVVGMRGLITFDGTNQQNWIISKKYLTWAQDVDGFKYVRYPNHLAPIKLEHALEAGFPDVRHGEDFMYSMKLKELGKLKSEVFIDKELYTYHFRSKK